MKAAVFDASDEVVESFALDDVVERDLGAGFAVAGEEVRVIGFGDPEVVAEFEGAGCGGDALFGEFLGDVVAVVFRAHFTRVEYELNGEGARLENNRLKGWEGFFERTSALAEFRCWEQRC